MDSLSSKFTLYDILVCFVSGVICSICVFLLIYFPDFQYDKLSDSLSVFLDKRGWWFWIIPFICVSYILGLLILTLSPLFIKIIGSIKKDLVSIDIEEMLPKGIYKRFKERFKEDFDDNFDGNRDPLLLMALLESKAVNSWTSIFALLSIHLTYRNICLIFFVTGIVGFIMAIAQSACGCWWFGFGSFMILLSVISFYGFIRHRKKFLSHLICFYANFNSQSNQISQKEELDAI